MPLIDYVQKNEADGEVKEILESAGYRKRSLMLELTANHPPLTKGIVEKSEHVLHGGNLASELKELIGVVVSQVNDCDYCTASHRENLFKLRMSGEDVLAIAREEFDQLPDRHRAAAEFAKTAATDPNNVTENDVDALRDVCFDDEDIIEILGVVGNFRDVNTYASALNADPADRGDELPRYLNIEEEELNELETLWKPD